MQCPYFTTRLLEENTYDARLYHARLFVVYICMAGSVGLRDDNGNELTVSQGQTVKRRTKNEGFIPTVTRHGMANHKQHP